MSASATSTEITADVLVVGGGPGGTPAALTLAAGGKRVVLVEQGAGLGGTCLFEGCVPSKIFRESAVRLHAADRGDAFGVHWNSAGKASLDWSRLLQRKRAILQRRADAALANASQLPTLQIVWGQARLLEAHRAEVRGHDGATLRVRYAQAVLASGSEAVRPAFPGADATGVHTAEQLLDLPEAPKSLLLIGGGPIGIEMAQIFRAMGTRVTLLQGRERILPNMEADLALLLQQRLIADGIDLRCGARAQAIERVGSMLQVQYRNAQGEMHTAEADTIALALGRRARLAGLGIENTRIRHDAQRVRVDAQLQTDEPDVYALGDITGQPMFAHWATAQALALAQHLLGPAAQFPRPEHNSAVIFSHPEFAVAGLTLEQARAAGIDAAVATYDYAIDARAQISDETGVLRFVYARDSHRIVGVHALIEGASDLIGEAAVIVRHSLTLEQVAQTIHPHPTLTEAMGLLARRALAALGAHTAPVHHPTP